jgi:acyl-CoA synthetase (AMP-forming)/AMP-acid ligase II
VSLSEIVGRFERIERDDPARPLVHIPGSGVSLTAADLGRISRVFAGRLAGAGFGPDHLLLVASGNRAATIALWLACRERDIVVMPVDPGTPAAEMRVLAERFGASAAIVSSSAAEIERLGTSSPFAPGVDPALSLVAIRDVDPDPAVYRGAAALKVTSGSTGLPKATFTRESQLVADSLHITAAMGIRPDDTQIAVIPLSHAYGLGNLAIPVLIQGTAIVLRDAFVPQQIVADAVAYDARVFPGVPFMFAHFAGNPAALPWPRTLNALMSAGAPLDASTVHAFARAFGVKVHSFYGTSETGGIAYDDSDDLDAAGTVGRPLPDVTVTLRSEAGAPQDGGRVHVASAAVASGYAGKAPSADDFTEGGFLTGDFGRFDAGRNLVLTGRASSFINVAGRKVQPEEVEQVLRTMTGIADVRVLGVADAVRGQQILACVVTDGASLTASAVRGYCAARLAAYKVPRTIVWLPAIPLTERGKTDRAKLEALVRDHLDRTAESGVL